MIGMPETLLRLKVANEVTLKDLENMLNQAINHILNKKAVTKDLRQTINELYPELFVDP